MAVFAFRARDMAGQEIRGTLNADSKPAALAQLDQRSLLPLEVNESAASGASFGSRIKLSHLSQFYGQLAELLRAGVPILRSLDTLSKQRGKPALTGVLTAVRDDVADGEALADAMGKHPQAFPKLHVAMVAAGEKGGFVEDVLGNMAEFVEKQDELRSSVLASLIYPMVLVAIGLAICVGVIYWFVPQFEPMLEKLPNKMWLTEVVFWISNVLRLHMTEVGIGVIAVAIALIALFRQPAAKRWLDKATLRAPLIGPVISMVCLCRFCRILGTLLRNGIPILQALRVSQDSAGNAILSEQIEIATESVRKGETLVKPLADSGIFPPEILDMIAIGEESNQLDSVLVNIAVTQEARTARKVQTVVRLIEPLILVVIAGMVATIAVALLVPLLLSSSMVS